MRESFLLYKEGDQMSKYGTFKYGKQEKYGRYTVQTDDQFSIGPHVQYRIRHHLTNASASAYITMIKESLLIPTLEPTTFRVRANTGEWVYTESVSIHEEVYKVRVRSIGDNQETSDWVYGERIELIGSQEV